MVGIDGGIAAGKTTLARALSALHSARLVEEDLSDISIISDFYRDPLRHAHATERAFLRMHAHLLLEVDRNHESSVVDFTLERDLAYARATLGSQPDLLEDWEREWRLVRKDTPPNDGVILLNCSQRVQLARISRRARSYEVAITEDYLRRLSSEVARVYEEHPPKRLIEVDSAKPVRTYSGRRAIGDLFR